MSPNISSLSRMSLHLGCHFKSNNAFLSTFGGILKDRKYFKPASSLLSSVLSSHISLTQGSRALSSHEILPWIEGYEDKSRKAVEKPLGRQSGKMRGSSAWNEAADNYFTKQDGTRSDDKWEKSSRPFEKKENEAKENIGKPSREDNEDDDSEPVNDERWGRIKKKYEKMVDFNDRKRARRPIGNNPREINYDDKSSWDNQDEWGRKTWREVTSSSSPKMVGEAVYGVGPVLAALTVVRREFYALYVQEGLDLSSRNKKKKDKQGIEQVLQMAGKLGLAVKEASKHDLNMLVDSRPHQGIVLDASPLQMVSIKELEPVSESEGKHSPLWVALDEVTDPQNFGAVIRSAYFFGATGVVVCAKNSAPLSGVVSKASAGSLELTELRSCRNMMQFLDLSARNGWRVLGASVESEALPLNEVSPGAPTILVLGSEGRGLRPLVKRSCSQLISIPGTLPYIATKSADIGFSEEREDSEARETNIGQEFNNFLAVESLNVSVAAGVLLYHLIGSSGHSSDLKTTIQLE
eukprot:Gb_28913 [translate_table: standard]